MNYDIFDEDYYLKKYPFVRDGIERGIVPSGPDLFRLRGFNQAEGDSIEMAIGYSETYSISPVGSDLAIAVGGDTIAILEGGANLTLTPTEIDNSAFQSFKLV